MPRRGWLILVALMIVAALAVLVLAPGDDGDDGDTPRDSAGQVDEQGDADTTTATTAAAGEDEGDEDQAAADPATTTTAASAAPEQSGSGQGTGEVPAGWRTYTDPEAGYTVAYPGSWKVEPADGPRIDFRDPETGSYLRVDWTDQPKPDPVADWRTQSQGFAASHQGYEEITIAPEEYRDYDAARWEFRYTDGGARLHAIDLGFVVGDKAYALFFQTKEELWSANQDVFTQIRDSFRPAGD